MKGIILAGGNGKRLYPLTKGVNKHLLPVFDKPMIFYPLSILMKAKIKEILIISTPESTPKFEELLGSGHQFGIDLQYKVQESPRGVTQALLLGEEFLNGDSCALILGDNLFYGQTLTEYLKRATSIVSGAVVFGYHVENPKRFGVIELSDNGKAISIDEKPDYPKSNYAVTGLYFYDNKVIEYAKNICPSERGEFEITDLNRTYLEKGELEVILLDDKITWFDIGTHNSLNEATNFVKNIEMSFHENVACLKEIAYLNEWISKKI